MKKILTVRDKEKEIYNIYYEKDFSGLEETFRPFHLGKRKTVM